MIKKSKITIPAKGKLFQGYLNVPFEANSLVIFSYSSANSRFSSRNRYLAETLNKENIATFLTDLLSEAEGRVPETSFDIDLLCGRLAVLTEKLSCLTALRGLPIGYFGSGTGAAGAMQAAVQLDDLVDAVVSRGGRPDLAQTLIRVEAPSLLIVGGLDTDLIALNQEAFSLLRCTKKLEIVEGASNLFEEPGKLNEFAALSTDWFKKHLLHTESIRQAG